MELLETHLETILERLRMLRRPVVDLLRRGLHEEEVRRLLRQVTQQAPEELVQLWHWRDGTELRPNVTKLDDIHFFPGFYFCSLEDAMLQYRAMRDDARWNPAWLPIFANGGGDFYAADLQQADSKHSPVIGFLLGEDDHRVEYESLTKMIETLAVCFTRGVVYVSSNGRLEMDDTGHATVAAQINPSVDLWKSG